MKRLTTLALVAACILGANHAYAQGSLVPTGAPAPSMKTLDQLEPRQPISTIGYNITIPGSYYLTTNLTGTTNGIVIAADNVTVDLNGFTISGTAGLYTGIVVIGTRTNLSIQNGTVTKFGAGINASSANNTRFERLKIVQSGNGLDAGTNAILADCTVYGCNFGIKAGPNSIVRNCLAQKNSGDGIRVGDNSIINGCTALSNTGANINGIVLLNTCTITDSTSASNSWYGIFLGEGSVAKNCSSRDNANSGFYGSAGSVISGCSARGNSNYGIFTFHATTIKDCTIDSNLGSGIYASYDCQVVGNTCSDNGPGTTAKGSGIYVGSTPCRIEGNNVTGNYYGIQVTSFNGANSLIIRNSASGNTTNYVFSGAMAGPIVTSATIGSSTNPNANFSY